MHRTSYQLRLQVINASNQLSIEISSYQYIEQVINWNIKLSIHRTSYQLKDQVINTSNKLSIETSNYQCIEPVINWNIKLSIHRTSYQLKYQVINTSNQLWTGRASYQYKQCTKRNYPPPPKVDRVTLKRYVMWYIALHILLDNLFLHIWHLTYHDRPNINLVMLYWTAIHQKLKVALG